MQLTHGSGVDNCKKIKIAVAFVNNVYIISLKLEIINYLWVVTSGFFLGRGFENEETFQIYGGCDDRRSGIDLGSVWVKEFNEYEE